MFVFDRILESYSFRSASTFFVGALCCLVCNLDFAQANEVKDEILIQRDYKTIALLEDQSIALLGGKGSVVVYDTDADSFSSEKVVDSTRFISHAGYAGLDYFVSDDHELWFRDPTTQIYSNVGGVKDRTLRCVVYADGKLVCSTLEGELYEWNGSSFEIVLEKAPIFTQLYRVYEAVIGIDLNGNLYRSSSELSEFEQVHLPSFDGSRSVRGLKVRDSLMLMWTATHVIVSRDSSESFTAFAGTEGRWNIDIANDSIVVGMNLDGEYITTNLNTGESERTIYSDIPGSILGFPEDGINFGDRILLCGFGNYICFVNTSTLVPNLKSTFAINSALYDGATFVDYLPDGTICAGYFANTLNYTQDGIVWKNISPDIGAMDVHILDHIQGVSKTEDGIWFAKSNNKVLWSLKGEKWTEFHGAGSRPVYLGRLSGSDNYTLVAETGTMGTAITFYDTLFARTKYHFQSKLYPYQCYKTAGDSLIVFGYYGEYNSDTMVATCWMYDTAANIIDKKFYSYFTSIKKIVQVGPDVFAIAQSGRSNYDNERYSIVKLNSDFDIQKKLLLPKEYYPISLDVVDDVLVSFSVDKKMYVFEQELNPWIARDADSTHYIDFLDSTREYVRLDEFYKIKYGKLDSVTTVVSVAARDLTPPIAYLENVYPNPGTSKFKLRLQTGFPDKETTVEIVSSDGAVVLDLSDQLQNLKPGTEQVLEWEMPKTSGSGVFLVVFKRGELIQTKKFILKK